MVAELERRTREHFEDEDATTLDYVVAWVEGGGTLRELAREVSAAMRFAEIKVELMSSHITRYLRREFGDAEVKRRLRAAREIGGHALIEESLEISDEDVDSSEDAARARNRISARQWTAERWNRDELSSRNNATSVTINVGSLHLDALRRRQASVELPAVARARLIEGSDEGESAIAGAITDGAEDVTVEVTSE